MQKEENGDGRVSSLWWSSPLDLKTFIISLLKCHFDLDMEILNCAEKKGMWALNTPTQGHNLSFLLEFLFITFCKYMCTYIKYKDASYILLQIYEINQT